jgi:hypothetical protein
MRHDVWGRPVTTESAAALAALEAATLGLLGQHDDTGAHLARAIETDPGLVAAEATLGLLHLASARRPRRAAALGALRSAREALAARGGTRRERGLVARLRRHAARPRGRPAAPVLLNASFA